MSGAARAVWPAELTLGTRRDPRRQVPAAPVTPTVARHVAHRACGAGMPLGAREFLLPAVVTRPAAITTGVAAGGTCGSAGTADAGVC
jgi:hypothetical protein